MGKGRRAQVRRVVLVLVYDSNGVNRRFCVNMKKRAVCELVSFLYVCPFDVVHYVVFLSSCTNEDDINMDAMDSSSERCNRVCRFCFFGWELLLHLHLSPSAWS